MKHVLLAIALATAFAIRATIAAAEPEVTTSIQGHAPDLRYSVEVNTVPMLMLLTPGSDGVDAGFEAVMSRHLTVFSDAYHLHQHVSGAAVTQMQQNASQMDAVETDAVTSGVATGARYYGDTFANSWYVGGRFGGSATHTDWVYGSERLADDSFAYTASLEAGYRWLWNSGFLVRVGADLGASDATSSSISDLTAAVGPTTDAQRSVEGKSPSNRPSLAVSYDVGLGYAF